MKKRVELPSLEFLIGKECWGTTGGQGTGSMIQLMLGEKIPREEQLPNMSLSPEIRANDAETSISLFYCSWRLCSADEIICSGAWSSNKPGGQMLSGLSNIVNQTVTSIELRAETLDLTIGFSNGLRIDVFNDYPRQEDDDGAYWIQSQGLFYSILGFDLEISED